ncbi:hypothetical protein K5X82_12425 [Halosquirtibacter xylanolyticus]|uniref:hypothetical protein n=1 Tax=Halosquirtibacter xylanolyticus TaxID=3374599 RepID=UPI003747D606|nr:hypothetical protein K5X82_12425 [Prolixibacteraceae bacterium]
MDQRITGFRLKEGREILRNGLPYLKIKDVLSALGFNGRHLQEGAKLAHEIHSITNHNDFVTRDHHETNHHILQDRRLIEIDLLRLRRLSQFVVDQDSILYEELRLSESLPIAHYHFIEMAHGFVGRLLHHESMLNSLSRHGFSRIRLEILQHDIERLRSELFDADSLHQSIDKNRKNLDIKLSELIELGKKFGITSRQILASCF